MKKLLFLVISSMLLHARPLSAADVKYSCVGTKQTNEILNFDNAFKSAVTVSGDSLTFTSEISPKPHMFTRLAGTPAQRFTGVPFFYFGQDGTATISIDQSMADGSCGDLVVEEKANPAHRDPNSPAASIALRFRCRDQATPVRGDWDVCR